MPFESMIGESPHVMYICEKYDICTKENRRGEDYDLMCGTFYLDHINFEITDQNGRAQFGCSVGESCTGDYVTHLIPYEEYKRRKADELRRSESQVGSETGDTPVGADTV